MTDHVHAADHDAHGGGHDAHDEHHPPRESPKLILIPIVILAALAALVGFANATPFGEQWENFKEYVEPRPEAVALTAGATAEAAAVPAAEEGAAGEEGGEAGAAGEESHATGCGHDDPGRRDGVLLPRHRPCRVQVVEGPAVARHRRRRARRRVGRVRRALHETGPPTRRSHRALVRAARRLPLPGQQVLPRLVVRERDRPWRRPPDRVGGELVQPERHRRHRQRRRVGRSSRVGQFVYRNIDQRVVDGAVNGSGAVATGAGSALRPVQSGKVGQYGALIFGAAAIGGARARDRQRVRIRIEWTSSPLRTGC